MAIHSAREYCILFLVISLSCTFTSACPRGILSPLGFMGKSRNFFDLGSSIAVSLLKPISFSSLYYYFGRANSVDSDCCGQLDSLGFSMILVFLDHSHSNPTRFLRIGSDVSLLTWILRGVGLTALVSWGLPGQLSTRPLTTILVVGSICLDLQWCSCCSFAAGLSLAILSSP